MEKIFIEQFDIIEKGNDLIFSFVFESDKCLSASVLYDGRNCLILKRNDQVLMFTNIDPLTRVKILKNDAIIFLEKNYENLAIAAYKEKIVKSKDIPYEDNFAKEVMPELENYFAALGDEAKEEIKKQAKSELNKIK